MDNGTMVEAFKFLNYCQLAKNSLVSRRYLNLIRTHRHKFALLDVDYISMYRRNVTKKDPAVIKMFNKEIPSEKYNEMIVRNGYSKQIPLEGRIAGKESAENVHDIFVFRADVHQYPNNRHGAAMAVFYADVELKDDNWPLFQHFFRLLMDPFIYVRSLKLSSQKGVLTLLAGAMTPNRERLHCKHLSIRFNGDTQKSIVWITDHVRCDVFEIYRNNDSNCDEEFLDLFMTGALCTSAVKIEYYDLSKVIVVLVQKFIGLKSRDEYQMVESIRGPSHFGDQGVVEELKRNCAEFIAEEKQFEGYGRRQVTGFINRDIGKKLTLNRWYGSFSIKITIT